MNPTDLITSTKSRRQLPHSYVSNGSTRMDALLGTRESLDDARAFFTQQHGDNNVYELLNLKKQFAHQ
jgi:hypothetical protein